MTSEHAQAHGHGHGHGSDGAGDGVDDLLDLDGEVLSNVWDDTLRRVASTADLAATQTDRMPRVVDLGAGTGNGTLRLARLLPHAEVVAVDVSEDALARVAERARQAGLDGRVRTVVADLDAGWPDLGPVDLTWASMSLHHLADPARTLGELRASTREGGVVAVWEFDEPLRFLRDDLGTGRPGLESRVMATLSQQHEASLPAIGAPWPSVLAEAGWSTVDEEHDVVIDEPSPEHPLAGAYARGWFARLSQHLADCLDADDARTLEALLDDAGPHALLHRTDLHLRGVRHLTIARA